MKLTLKSFNESSFNIECLEDCKCIKLPYKLIYRVMKKDSNLNQIITKYYLREVERLENRAKSLTLMNAKERYADFCKQYPHFCNRIELKYIASYIRIRPASLSRIRKEIKKSSSN